MAELTQRQQAVIDTLKKRTTPVSGQALAEKLGVTRQVIVHDIAVLRAAGIEILSTPKGYLLLGNSATHLKRTLLAVCHRPEDTETELNTFVDCGVRVLDVRVEHSVYGELIGNLYLSSRRDVAHFMRKIEGEGAPLLSTLTGGLHYHQVEYAADDMLQEAIAKLQGAGIQVL
ncbi:transcription repressor NadR [Alicyclobacillus acidiphilus]|uniref:transcription repressor NadR n=1 Tax=Alicyclobacillus acidiphilus TaxID=182455 RepID=UPI000832B208|nr:transcription repressor NadR [Alicyclobacillus acidiphilus]